MRIGTSMFKTKRDLSKLQSSISDYQEATKDAVSCAGMDVVKGALCYFRYLEEYVLHRSMERLLRFEKDSCGV